MDDALSGGMEMYKKLYFYLFNRITDALAALAAGDVWLARQILIAAQRECEERCIAAEEN